MSGFLYCQRTINKPAVCHECSGPCQVFYIVRGPLTDLLCVMKAVVHVRFLILSDDH